MVSGRIGLWVCWSVGVLVCECVGHLSVGRGGGLQEVSAWCGGAGGVLWGEGAGSREGGRLPAHPRRSPGGCRGGGPWPPRPPAEACSRGLRRGCSPGGEECLCLWFIFIRFLTSVTSVYYSPHSLHLNQVFTYMGVYRGPGCRSLGRYMEGLGTSQGVLGGLGEGVVGGHRAAVHCNCGVTLVETMVPLTGH